MKLLCEGWGRGRSNIKKKKKKKKAKAVWKRKPIPNRGGSGVSILQIRKLRLRNVKCLPRLKWWWRWDLNYYLFDFKA